MKFLNINVSTDIEKVAKIQNKPSLPYSYL